MNYIDQNPVVVELAATPEEWKASAAFYKKCGISNLVDLTPANTQPDIKLLPPIPYILSRLIPPDQLDHILYYIGAYAVALDKLFDLLPKIPIIGSMKDTQEPKTYLHYYTPTHNYYIYEYDPRVAANKSNSITTSIEYAGSNADGSMNGKVTSYIYPAETKQQTFSLSNLKKNKLLKLEISTTVFG